MEAMQQVRFHKIVPEGQALGDISGKATFAVGPLPGELAEVVLTKQKKRHNQSELRAILEPSPHRHGPAEDHALVCAPWQGIDYKYQLRLKASMIRDAFTQHRIDIEVEPLIASAKILGYRNRLDFMTAPFGGKLELAFHQRASWHDVVALPNGCALGSEAMNTVALAVVAKLNSLDSPPADGTLTIRQSVSTNSIVAVFTSTHMRKDWSDFRGIAGCEFAVAAPQKNSGVSDVLTFNRNVSPIVEMIDTIPIAYPYSGFFQTNIPVFNRALGDIKSAAAGHTTILELYGGVGAIGIPLSRDASVTSIEVVASATKYAQLNAKNFGSKSFQAITSASERLDDAMFEGYSAIVLDPPRSGLHSRVIRRILDSKIERIIYLSCNPVTQARDVALLQTKFKPGAVRTYDFYPQTLHAESLVVLDRKLI